MGKNTGTTFEDDVFREISRLVESNQFLVGEPYVRVRRRAKYHSPDRGSCIEFEMAVEKYLADPDVDTSLRPSLIVVVECKDYARAVPVDDVEEFHAKLQQIGADKTKGIIITRTGAFQKSALSYAQAKGITLARKLPDNQVQYVLHMLTGHNFARVLYDDKEVINMLRALTEKDYESFDNKSFFSLTGEGNWNELLCNLLK